MLKITSQAQTAAKPASQIDTESNLLADMSGFAGWLLSHCCGATPKQTELRCIPKSATGRLMFVEALSVPQLVSAVLYPDSGLSYFAVATLRYRYVSQMSGREPGAARSVNHKLAYADVFNGDLNGWVVVGIDEDGDLTEVWAGGVNVGPFLADTVCADLERGAYAAFAEQAISDAEAA